MPARRKGREGHCRDCDQPLTDENWTASDKAAKKYVCRSCRSASSRVAALRDPERTRSVKRNAALIRKFGITAAEYDALFAAQKGVCALCEKPEPADRALAVDHDHATGRVRGLLCTPCNRSLGNLGDTEAAIERALAYVREPVRLRVVA